jgi:nicotinamidase-related amidase
VKAALLVVDVQKAFFKDPATARLLDSAIEYINAAIDLFRKKDLPVICVQHLEEADNLVPGQEGFDLPESLKILPADVHIHKTYGNSFNKTPLLAELQRHGIDTVIVTGYCAEYCVLSTCRGARDLDLTPIIMRGAIASGVEENIRFVQNVEDIISYWALEKALG